MQEPDQLAIDLNGNVLTCQNVGACDSAPNGKSHGIGTIADLAAVRLDTSTTWAFREECSRCPVLQLCAGGCMFQQGELFRQSCDISFLYSTAIMAAALYAITGKILIRIEGTFSHAAALE
jgi:uncharacterized protein